MNIIIIVLVVYILGMIGIGVFYSKQASTSKEEYYLGGRGIGPVVTAIASGSTGRSAWLILGMTSTGFLFGAGAIWSVFFYSLTEMFAMGYAGRRLRIFTKKMNSLTWPDYLESRLDDKTNAIRLTSSIIIAFFYVIYIGAQLKGSTKMFAFLFGMEPLHAIIISAIVVMVYTLAGGYRAVVFTSFIQGLLMMVTLVVVPLFLLFSNLGTGIVNNIMSIEPLLLNNPLGMVTGSWIIAQVMVALSSWGQVHILTRYMSIKDPATMKKAAFGNGIWNIVCATGACFAGLFARLMWNNASVVPGADPELIIPAIAGQFMHPIIGGIFIAGIVSAIMSTIDQLLLTSTSTITKDLYEGLFNRTMEDKKLINSSRIVMLLITILAIIIALTDNQTIYWFVLFAFGGLGAAFGPLFILSVYWKKVTRQGALAGMLTGLLVTIVWYNVPALKSMLYEAIPALTLSTLAIMIISKLTSNSIPENVDELFESLNEPQKEVQ